jgi:hypothetical protein
LRKGVSYFLKLFAYSSSKSGGGFASIDHKSQSDACYKIRTAASDATFKDATSGTPQLRHSATRICQKVKRPNSKGALHKTSVANFAKVHSCLTLTNKVAGNTVNAETPKSILDGDQERL